MEKINSGVYLYTRDEVIKEQKEWNRLDGAKNFDFTTSDYWIITDNGIIQAYTLRELKDELSLNIRLSFNPKIFKAINEA